MESSSGRGLSRETVATCLKLLRRLKEQTRTSVKEQYAVSHLVDWLSQVDCEDSSDTDEALDESSRALLASYRDKFSRKRLAIGNGDVLGSSPSIRGSFFKAAKTKGDEALAQELDKLDEWADFDVFKVANLTNGHPLEAVTMALCHRFDLIEKLRLDSIKLHSFLKEIEAAYSHPNAYHNSTHAADVTQSLGCILTLDSFSAQLTEMEMLSMIIAAAVHDVGHPGVTNDFLVTSHAETALTYNDSSVNENMHTSLAFRILLRPQNNFLSHLPDSHFRFFRRTVIAIVLSTDMAGHTDLVNEFVANLNLMGPELREWHPEKRCQVLQMCVHCSDIANPAKPLRFSLQWTDRVTREFFAQGDLEREKGMPVSPLCDREKVEIGKSQLIFLERVVRPCYNALKGLAPNSAALALQYVNEACHHWEVMHGNGVTRRLTELDMSRRSSLGSARSSEDVARANDGNNGHMPLPEQLRAIADRHSTEEMPRPPSGAIFPLDTE